MSEQVKDEVKDEVKKVMLCRIEFDAEPDTIITAAIATDVLEDPVFIDFKDETDIPEFLRERMAILDVADSPDNEDWVEDIGKKTNDTTYWCMLLNDEELKTYMDSGPHIT